MRHITEAKPVKSSLLGALSLAGMPFNVPSSVGDDSNIWGTVAAGSPARSQVAWC